MLKACLSNRLVGAIALALVLSAVKSFAADARTLVGKNEAATLELLGKPMGRMATTNGPLWIYPDWRVQFDKSGKVLNADRDLRLRVSADAATTARLNQQSATQRDRAVADANAKVQANAAAESRAKIQVVSNGGKSVDLASLLPAGKVAIVDFYADWCGPCRAIAPQLEEMVKNDPDLVLIKVDIVNWGTPVTSQHGIESVPNLRVFDRRKQQLGGSTSSLAQLKATVAKAKSSR